jgi:signal transduction histidine kinase
MEGQIKNNNLEIAVVDQGVGISSDDQARLFTKFFQVDNEATRSVGGVFQKPSLGLGTALSLSEKLPEFTRSRLEA